MLARRTTLRLPGGIALETPLLIPSFSSKGFAIEEGRSSVNVPLSFAAPLIQDVMLVSAYDLGHGLVLGIEGLEQFPALGPLSNPSCLVVDSGQYETEPAYDLYETYEFPYEPLPWGQDRLTETTRRLSAELPAIIVNLDIRGPIDQQIDQARHHFEGFPGFLHDFLVKPEGAGQFLSSEVLAANVGRFGPFDILGVTEKELGNTLLNRLVVIARLRRSLDEAGMIGKPIHVFGSLDPLLSPLYFLAGAELFDGLSWLRYAYYEGLSVYGESLAALRGELGHHKNQRRATMVSNNLSYLQDLEIRMRRFLLVPEGDFAVFGRNAERLHDGYGALQTRIGGA